MENRSVRFLSFHWKATDPFGLIEYWTSVNFRAEIRIFIPGSTDGPELQYDALGH
jgi:hypothetical protein